MDSAVRSHRFYKSVVASNRRTTRSREGTCWPVYTINLRYIAVINDSQIVGHTLSKFYSQITWYYTTRRDCVVRRQASVILLGEGGKEKA